MVVPKEGKSGGPGGRGGDGGSGRSHSLNAAKKACCPNRTRFVRGQVAMTNMVNDDSHAGSVFSRLRYAAYSRQAKTSSRVNRGNSWKTFSTDSPAARWLRTIWTGILVPLIQDSPPQTVGSETIRLNNITSLFLVLRTSLRHIQILYQPAKRFSRNRVDSPPWSDNSSTALPPDNMPDLSARIETIDLGPRKDVTDFKATARNRLVQLSWTNPPDPDFVGVGIRYRTDGTFPATETDGLPIGDFNCRRIGVRVNAFRPQFFYSSHKAIGVILQCYNDSAQIAYN